MTTGRAGERVRAIHPWRIAVIAGLASFVDGAALSANGIALVIYQHTIGLTGDQVGLLTAIVTFGLALGALVGGRAGDVFGRRKVFILTMAMIVLGSLAPTFGRDFWLLFVGLAILGIGVGADLPVSLATIAEVATEKNRGAMLVFTQLLWVLASVVVIVITSTTAGLGRASGQLLYGVIVVVGIAGLLLRLTVPESPLWLQAREERRRGIHTVRADHVKVRDLFKPPFRRPVIVLVVYYTLMSIAGNVAASYVTYVAVNVSKVPIAEFTAWSLVTVPATFIALGVMMKFIDTRARIPLFVAGGVLFAVGFLVPVVAGIGLTSLVVAFAIAVIGSILCGEPIARVWANESFPTMLRSTGQGFVFTVGRVVVAIVSAVAPAVILLSPQLFFVALAAAALLGTVVAWVGFRGGRVANEFDVESRPEPALLDAA